MYLLTKIWAAFCRAGSNFVLGEYTLRAILFSLFLALTLAGTADAAPLSGAAAVVNGELITSRALEKALEPELAMSRLNPKNPAHAERIQQLRKETLDSMITEKILLQEAAKQGITVSEDMIEDEMNRIISESGMPPDIFAREAEKQGLNLDFMREKLRTNITTQMLMGRMVFSKVVITDEEIASYFQQSGGFVPAPPAPPVQVAPPVEPEPQYEIRIRRVRFGMIIYPPEEDAEKWAKAIASGKMSFAEVAKKVSQGPNPEGGGDLGMINIGDLAPGLKDIAHVLQKGQVTPVLDLGTAKAQIKLIDLVATKREIPQPKPEPLPQPELPKDMVFDSLNAEASSKIEEYLRRPLLEARFEEYTKQLRSKAIIDIKI